MRLFFKSCTAAISFRSERGLMFAFAVLEVSYRALA
jgi:hypothetical protein